MDNYTVEAWEENISIPTYAAGMPDKNPMFFEKRVYQGSSGTVYPHPVIEKIADDKTDKIYRAVFLENRFIKIMILPELGGRIQMAYDKIKQRHFIYYNRVIKPALVGLTGPWISGGIEFNWPQHHRPSTFCPVNYRISAGGDGSKTIWINEAEQMFHTKGMAGFTLYPQSAYVEIRVKLLNTSELAQTFLWWANPAVKVNDAYQSVFPPDVHAVFDHGKRDVSSFPIATGTYYKVDYAPGTDISMYKNIPVPTSYMAINSQYDFMGGYEHDTKAGMLHVANHHISPGKKQWTWGHGDFGQAWDRQLTDEDGPYIELMAGVFTDNQPDFTWLLPNEEKSFTQYFLPYHEIGLVKNATKDLLLNIDLSGNTIGLGLYAASPQNNIYITVYKGNEILHRQQLSMQTATTFTTSFESSLPVTEAELMIIITSAEKQELLRYHPAGNKQKPLPAPAKAAASPETICSHEQLFLTGQHLEQYRHATRSPLPYYDKILSENGGDIRANNALGLWWLRRGQFKKSIPYFTAAIVTSTEHNPNPYDGECFYYLGIALAMLGQFAEAYDAFYKAAWDKRWKDSAFFWISRIDLSRGNWQQALEHIETAISNNTGNSKAYVVKAAALRKGKRYEEAITVCVDALEKDVFNLGARYELSLVYTETGEPACAAAATRQVWNDTGGNEQDFLAWALDYVHAGCYQEAMGLLQQRINKNASNPLLYYCMAWCAHNAGDTTNATKWLQAAAAADTYLCFPNRLEEITILQFAIAQNAADANAPYYLGNLWYDKRQYSLAIRYWEQSANINKNFPTVWRNLGIAYFNKQQEQEKALACFEKAFSLDMTDARVLMEYHQLLKRMNKPPGVRRALLEQHMQIVLLRDDLYIEYITLLNLMCEHRDALGLLMQRQFHPWEGGEGKVSAQYIFSLIELAKTHMQSGEYNEAVGLLSRAQVYPHNLGEGKLYGAQENDIFYWLGCAYAAMGDTVSASACFVKATKGNLEPNAAIFYNDQQPDSIFYQGLSFLKLNQPAKGAAIFKGLIAYGLTHIEDAVTTDYFAVSLPDMLVFEDDLQLRNRVHCLFMQALGYVGLEQYDEARSLLQQVLAADAQHAKAASQLQMLEQQLVAGRQ